MSNQDINKLPADELAGEDIAEEIAGAAEDIADTAADAAEDVAEGVAAAAEDIADAVDDEDDDVKIVSVAAGRDQRVIEEESDGLFDGLDDADEGGDDVDTDDDADIEATTVSVAKAGRVPVSAPVKKQRGVPANKSGRSTSQRAAASGQRHAVTTSRGVVYVESYSDEEYDAAPGRKRVVVGIIIALVIIGALVASGMMFVKYCRRVVSGDRVYSGITLNGKSVAGLTRDELDKYISDTYSSPIARSTINVKVNEENATYPLDAIITLPDTKDLADRIYNESREGGLIKRAFSVLRLKETGKDFSLNYTVNEDTITSIASSMNSKSRTKIDPTYTVEEDRIVFTYGRNGVELKSEDIKAKLTDYTDNLLTALSEGNISGTDSGTVTLVPTFTEFRKLLKINIMNELPARPTDARIERKSSTEVWIVPETDGAEYDEALLDEILLKINTTEGEEGQTEELPVAMYGTVLTKELYENVLFRDRLGAGSNKNVQEDDPAKAPAKGLRDTNIKLAVDAINSYVVMPGETFSLLNTLKVTDDRNGYVSSMENYSGFDTPVKGGGISQVATALYNAALVADMGIFSRTKYPYAPNFGLMGFDAYVDATSRVDFIFVNKSDMPV
ncbi:MAG: VanW family protein, partial [Clostridia bacterium]|nr:VanW family protein [Clostridia bacterium]